MLAWALVEFGRCLVDAGQTVEAEAILREGLAVCERHLAAEDWRVAETRGLLGACLTKRQQFAEAEPLLLESYRGLSNPRSLAEQRLLREARQRLVELYIAWGKDDKVTQWRREWEASKTFEKQP
jgi:hypothetical protein